MLTLVNMMTPPTEGDLVRGRLPDLTSLHRRCGGDHQERCLALAASPAVSKYKSLNRSRRRSMAPFRNAYMDRQEFDDLATDAPMEKIIGVMCRWWSRLS
jgi:hypothetical protein